MKYYIITNGITEETALTKGEADRIFEDYCLAYEFVEMLYGNKSDGYKSIAQSW